MKITMNTEHYEADGYYGTWHAINSCVYRGETFYLMEHGDSDDEIANIAVHEDGTLVAGDLWDGFDDGFKECANEFLDYKNGIGDDHSEMKPYIVTITETYARGVVVWAKSRCEAESDAQDLCNEYAIVLSDEDFDGRDCICKGVAQESALEFYEQYEDEHLEK